MIGYKIIEKHMGESKNTNMGQNVALFSNKIRVYLYARCFAAMIICFSSIIAATNLLL